MSKRSRASSCVAVGGAFGALVLLAACTGSQGGHPASLRSSPPAKSASGLGMPSCAGRSGGATGYLHSPDLGPGTQLVLGRIAINRGHSYHPVPVRDAGRWRYWQKRPILIRANTGPVTVSIPPSWRGRAAITYGTTRIGRSLVLISCQKPRGVWDAYAGGIYLRDQAACVPLTFRLGNRTTTVRLNMAGRC
jgi:hypothetical protein